MRIFTFILFFIFLTSTAWAQSTTILPQYNISPGVNQSVGTATPLPVAVYSSATSGYVLTSNGSGAATFQPGGGSGSTPGGTNGQIQYNNNGAFGGFTTSGDSTVNTTTGVMINTGINGTPVTTSLATGALTVTSSSANAIAIGTAGATNPAFAVNTATANAQTGLLYTAAATGGTATLAATDPGVNSGLTISSKGTGILTLSDPGANKISFSVNGSTVANIGYSSMNFAPTSSTGSSAKFAYTSPSNTNTGAGTEQADVYFNLSASDAYASNTAVTIQRDFRITGHPWGFGTAGGVITDHAAFAVDGPTSAGTNATITNSSGIYVGAATLTGTVTNSYGINVSAASGASNNYAAQFNGGVVLLNQTTGTNADFLCLSSAGLILIQSSSCTISKRDFKEVIHEVRASDAVNDILAMKPTYFKFKQTTPANPDPNFTKPQYGFIAEDMAAIDPGFTIYENDGKTPKSWDERRVVPLTVKMLQIHDEEIKQLSKGLPASHRNWFGRFMDYLENAS